MFVPEEKERDANTKVGVSYVDHMNDNALEVNRFSRGCYQALSSPVFEERDWGRGYLDLSCVHAHIIG